MEEKKNRIKGERRRAEFVYPRADRIVHKRMRRPNAEAFEQKRVSRCHGFPKRELRWLPRDASESYRLLLCRRIRIKAPEGGGQRVWRWTRRVVRFR